jgi:hypothetical protein
LFDADAGICRLLGTRLDPTEENRGDDPSPLYVAETANRRQRLHRATTNDGARLFDGHGGRPPQPYVLNRG